MSLVATRRVAGDIQTALHPAPEREDDKTTSERISPVVLISCCLVVLTSGPHPCASSFPPKTVHPRAEMEWGLSDECPPQPGKGRSGKGRSATSRHINLGVDDGSGRCGNGRSGRALSTWDKNSRTGGLGTNPQGHSSTEIKALAEARTGELGCAEPETPVTAALVKKFPSE